MHCESRATSSRIPSLGRKKLCMCRQCTSWQATSYAGQGLDSWAACQWCLCPATKAGRKTGMTLNLVQQATFQVEKHQTFLHPHTVLHLGRQETFPLPARKKTNSWRAHSSAAEAAMLTGIEETSRVRP